MKDLRDWKKGLFFCGRCFQFFIPCYGKYDFLHDWYDEEQKTGITYHSHCGPPNCGKCHQGKLEPPLFSKCLVCDFGWLKEKGEMLHECEKRLRILFYQRPVDTEKFSVDTEKKKNKKAYEEYLHDRELGLKDYDLDFEFIENYLRIKNS